MASSPDSQVREHPAAAYHARRRSEVDAKILTAARDVLHGEGLSALTVERVAADSGVAKTTIYRRFKHRLDLATAALVDPSAEAERSDDVDIQTWLRQQVTSMSDAMQTRAAEVIGAGLMHRHDEEFTALYKERVVDARAETLRPRLAQAVEAGEVRRDVSVETIISLITGSVIGIHLGGDPVPTAVVDDTTTLLWSAIGSG